SSCGTTTPSRSGRRSAGLRTRPFDRSENMEVEQERLLAAVIAAHENHQVVGRTRLQKTIKLLQRLGLPTDYGYMNFFYGPYSEAVQTDIRLLAHQGLVSE